MAEHELVKAARKLWDAHGVVVSNGGTGYSRHIEPVIYEIGKILKRMDSFDGPPWTETDLINNDVKYDGCFALGYRNDDNNPDTYGMYAGPVKTIEEAEQYEPDPKMDRR